MEFLSKSVMFFEFVLHNSNEYSIFANEKVSEDFRKDFLICFGGEEKCLNALSIN